MDHKLIGTCFSCQNLFCETPKVKDIDPMNGCNEWSTQEASGIDFQVRIIVINGD